MIDLKVLRENDVSQEVCAHFMGQNSKKDE